MAVANSFARIAADEAYFALFASLADFVCKMAAPSRPIDSTSAVMRTSSKPNPFVRYIPCIDISIQYFFSASYFLVSHTVFMISLGKN